MSFIDQDYREIIRQHYRDRSLRNPAYSLRAYARDLGLAYSRLHDTMHGKKGLSVESAKRVAAKLGFTAEESQIFLTKVEAEHSRSPERRADAARRLENLKSLHAGPAIQEESFRQIQDWHCLALLELTRVAGFEESPDWIARRLSIRPEQAEHALRTLLELGFLSRKDGRLAPSGKLSFVDSQVPSSVLRVSQEQALQKAQQALHFQAAPGRASHSLTVCLRKEDLPLAKSFLQDVMAEFERRFGRAAAPDAVYDLSVQLFRLDKEEG